MGVRVRVVRVGFDGGRRSVGVELEIWRFGGVGFSKVVEVATCLESHWGASYAICT